MDLFELVRIVVILAAVAGSFVISASVGLGGSLLMVPTLTLALGAKEGVALSALLLGCNNIVKVVAYRRTIPWRKAARVVVLVSVGAFAGAVAMTRASEGLVTVAVLVMFVLTLALERWRWEPGQVAFAPLLAFASGASSGFSGTSGPLKGVAIRNLRLDRRHFAGAASVASLVGDLTKAAVFADARLLGPDALLLAVLAVPLMILATRTGVALNQRAGERGFAVLFWGVIAGYGARLVLAVV